MIAFDLPAKAKAGKLFLVPVKEAKEAVNAVSEWVNFCTWDKYGAASPAVSGTPGADAVVIKLEVNPDELKYHQQGRAVIEDNVIRIIGRTAADLKPLVNVTLNRFPTDTDAEIALVIEKCKALGVNVVLSTVWVLI